MLGKKDFDSDRELLIDVEYAHSIEQTKVLIFYLVFAGMCILLLDNIILHWQI